MFCPPNKLICSGRYLHSVVRHIHNSLSPLVIWYFSHGYFPVHKCSFLYLRPHFFKIWNLKNKKSCLTFRKIFFFKLSMPYDSANRNDMKQVLMLSLVSGNIWLEKRYKIWYIFMLGSSMISNSKSVICANYLVQILSCIVESLNRQSVLNLIIKHKTSFCIWNK